MEERTLLSSVTFTVNSLNDAVDANVGDGVADADLGTPGLQTTLRAAIMEANASTAETVEIIIPVGTYNLTITGGGGDLNGDLNITNTISAIEISGGGSGAGGTLIDSRGISTRVFDVAASAHRLSLEDLTLRGQVNGAQIGGAIETESILELDNVLVELSSAQDGGGLAVGAGGFATVLNSVFDNNSATATGGAFQNSGVLTIAGSTFSNNSANDAGAGIITGGNTVIESSVFSANVAGGIGALDIRGTTTIQSSRFTSNIASSGGTGAIGVSQNSFARIDSSTIDGNTAATSGGGISVASGSTLDVTNTTISGNTGTTAGGGIFTNGAVNLSNSTIAFNISVAGGGGAVANPGGTVNVGNTILSNSLNDSMQSIADVVGAVATLGNNIVQDAGAATGFSAPMGDQIGVDPLLLALADNGGANPTHALQLSGPASPAIDAGNPGFAPGNDQRLVPRSAGLAPDIGAFEEDPLVYFVNTTADTPDANSMDNLPIDGAGNVSLRSAIMALNNFEGGNGVIILPPGQFTLTQTSGGGADSDAVNDLDIYASNVTLIGTGSLSTRIDAIGLAVDGVDGGGNDRVLEIFGTDTSITGVTIANGNAGSLEGGGIMLADGLHLTRSSLEANSAANGGGLATGFSSVGSLILDGVTAVENTATGNGGGLLLQAFFSQTPTIVNSDISRNSAGLDGGGVASTVSLNIVGTSLFRNTSARDGGGIAFGDEFGTDPFLSVINSSIEQNTADGFGGGLAISGTAEITTSSVVSNSSLSSGGGVAATSGALRITGSTIAGNSASVDGGGIGLGLPAGAIPGEQTEKTRVDISFSDLSFNSAGQRGGGVGNSAGEVFVFSSLVENNSAANGGGLANAESGLSQVVSSTFSGNTTGGFGGGLLNEGGALNVTNATVTLNTAAIGGGIASRNNAATTVQNTIIAQNVLSGGGTGGDAFADTVITSGGNNVIGVGEFGFVNGVKADQTGTLGTPLDARLGPLGDNGGGTLTHALLTSGPASPAIDAGNNSNLDANDSEVDVDQRGAERILGASVDVGAFESGSNAIFVTTTQDVVDGGDGVISLREAVNMANAAPNADTIVLPAGQYSLTLLGDGDDSNVSGDLDIIEEVTIIGYGMGVTIVDGSFSDRVFDVQNSIATFLDMTIQNGRAIMGDGGGIQAEFSTTTLERVEVADNLAGGSGGGVSTFNGLATLNVYDSVFRNNSANSGGAIVTNEDTLNVSNTTFDNNTASSADGGAISIFGADASIVGSEFTSNMAFGGRGGAVYIEEFSGNTVTIDASRFAGNVAASGGGVSIRNETVVITGSEFAEFDDGVRLLGANQATMGDGGAIENIGGNLTVQSTLIASNSSNSFGGGIVNAGSGATLLLEDSVVESNSATGGGGGLFTDQTATVRRSTFSMNFASDGGGIDNGGSLLLVNSTLSGNSVTNQGGGLANRFSGSSTIEHATITANSSGMGGGGILNSAVSVSLKNTIVAGNFDSLQNADVQGAFTSNGNNLIGDVDGATGFPGSNDILGGNSLTASVLTASNASPIQIDTALAHTLQTGDLVRIEGVFEIMANSAANGTFRVTVIDADSFTLADLDGFPVSGTGSGTGGQVFRLADAQLGPLQNNTAPEEFVQGGQEPSVGGGGLPGITQPFTHRPLAGSPVIDAGDATGIESYDNRGAGFPRNVDGDNAGGAAPDIGALEVFLTSVTGRKFDDTNGNGVQDMLETGLSGVTVYADLNENGILDSGDPFTSTDGNGDYVLELVPPGAVIVSEQVPDFMFPGLPGFRQTFPSSPFGGGVQLLSSAGDMDGVDAVVTADFNQDGLLDVAYTIPGNLCVEVLIQQQNGSFIETAYVAGDTPVSLVAEDFNNDSFVDLIVANNQDDTVTVLRNQGNGTFVLSATGNVGSRPVDVVTGDFNNDGTLDIATVNSNSNNVTILTGDGAGGLTASPFATLLVGNNPRSLVTFDVNRDGLLDLATADSGSDQITVLVNQGGGTFNSVGFSLPGSQVTDIEAGDFDRDGLIDLAVGRPSTGDVAVIFNRGSLSSFQVVSLGAVSAVRDVRAVDIDGDGFLDLAAVGSAGISVFQNDSNSGTFQAGIVIATGSGPESLGIGDLNNDGRPDFITANNGSDDVTSVLNLTGSQLVTTVTGVVAPGVDFGNQHLSSVSGLKFEDRNSNGLFDGLLDDFNSGDPDPLWQNEVGNWRVTSGEYEAASPGNSPLTYTSLPFELDDFEVTFGVNNVNDGGVFLRSTAFDPAEPSGVLLVTGAPTTGGTGLYWHIVSNGVEGSALNQVNGLFTQGDDITIRVTVEGDTYSAFLNGSSTPATTLTTSMFNSGRFGLYSNSSQTFDNVDLPEQGIPGVEIFLDLNDNGRQDSFEPVTTTRTDDPATIGTNETGRYSFNNVVPGPVRVYEVVPAGFQQTTPRSLELSGATDIGSVGDNAVDSLIADFDGDGWNDLIVLSVDSVTGTLHVFAGTGTQYVNLVTAYGVGTNPEAVSAGDLDGDGDLDLAVANAGDDNVQLFENTGGLTFVLRQTLSVSGGDSPNDVVLTDINGDGLADVIVANANTPLGARGVSLFTNNDSSPGAGNYSFTGPTNLNSGGQTVALEAADLDGDGDSDLVAVVSDTDQVLTFENQAGVFANPIAIDTGDNPAAIAISDLNQDGRTDLIVGKQSAGFALEVYFGIGLFHFAPASELVTTLMPDSLAVADLDQNGYDDIVLTDRLSGQIGVVLNFETGIDFFADFFQAGTQITGVSTGDLDGDGLIDIVGVEDTGGARTAALLNRFGSVSVFVSAGGSAIADFGNIELATVAGTTFHDQNENGIQDMDEPGLSGITVFADENGNGQLDAGETSAVSGPDGNFTVFNVQPLGQDRLVVAEQPGFVPTFQLDTPVSIPVAGGARSENIGDIVTAGDLDGDGRAEVVSANFTVDSVSIVSLDGNGVSSRIDAAVGDTPLTVRLADVNEDGNPDIITANFGSGDVSVLLGNGNGTFGASTQFSAGPTPQSIAIADLNGDGKLDIAVSSATSGNLQVLFGDGVGGFSAPSAVTVAGVSSGEDLESGDFDGDGDVDLAIVHAIQDRASILLNNGGGTFGAATAVAVGVFPLGLATGDFDEDGDVDLAVTNVLGGGEIRFLTNNGSGAFVAGIPTTLGGSPEAVVVGDVNSDGHLDFVVANQVQTSVRVLFGDGAGGIASTMPFGVGGVQDGVALADISGNGRPEIITETFQAGTVTILQNLTGNLQISPAPGETVTGQDFGLIALPGSISGTKFRDDNENGVQDAGEPGLAGVTIYLDLDNDDVPDGGEPSTVTDVNGFYEFTGLESLRQYTVSEVVPAGFQQFAPFHPGFAFSGDAAAGGPAAGIVTGDFDGQFGDDIAVTFESTNQVGVLLRQANGTYGAPTLINVGMVPFSIAAADFDGANGIDLAVANEQDGTVLILENNGSGIFTAQMNPITVEDFPLEIVVADVDGANGPDLVVVNDQNNSFRVLLNDGMGELSAQAPFTTGVSPTSVAVADFDEDGDQDIAVTTAGDNKVTVFSQTSPGTFVGQTPIATGTDPSRVRTADLDNDGTFDLVVVNQQSSSVTVVLNDSLASPVTYATFVAGEAIVLADFNSDGFTDVAVSGEDTPLLSLLLNDGLGAFGTPTLIELEGTFPVEIAPITLNADGDIDLAITDVSFNEVLLLTSTTGSHSVSLDAGESVAARNFANRNINQTPVINVPPAQSTNEDVALVFTDAGSNRISIADADEALNPGSELEVTLSVSNGTLTLPVTTGLIFQSGTANGESTLTFTGSLTTINSRLNGLRFDPTSDFFGMVTLTVEADDQGNFGTGGSAMDFEVVNITIDSVNDVPVATDDLLSNVVEDSVTRVISIATLTANDLVGPANESGQTLTITGVNNPVGGTVVINGPNVEFTPSANFNGVARFDYTVQDNGIPGLTDIGRVTFVVSEVNDAPVAMDDALSSVSEDSVTRVISIATLTANDLVGPANESGQTLTITGVNNPVGGTVVINGPNVEFTPSANFNGVARFDYTVRDNGTTGGSNNFKTDTGRVMFNVSEVNDVPVAMDDALSSVAEDSETRVIPFASLTTNDSKGPTSENGQTLTITGVNNPVGGAVVINGPNVEFTPSANFNGVARFDYTVQDNGIPGLTDIGQVTFNVSEVNDASVLSANQLGDITYLSNNPPIAVIPSIVVNDVDDEVINSAVVRIQSGFESTDILTAAPTGGILAVYDGVQGVLTLSGQSSLANYQAVLRSVTYANTSTNPSEVTRTVSYVVNDGTTTSNAISRNIEVQLRPATVSGVVWADADENGLRDELELRVQNVIVQVLDSENTVLASTVTGQDGAYNLAVPGRLLPGDFKVRIIASDGKHFTARDAGDSDSIDSDPNVLTGEALVPHLGVGENRQNIDAGLLDTTVAILDAVPVNEGDGAPVSTLDFRVALNGRSPHQVTVNVRVVAGTDGQPVAQATVGTDVASFPQQGGLLPVTFNPGQTERIVSVPIIGDTDLEPDEGFEVRLSSSIQAEIVDPVGFGLIGNDDFSVPTVVLGNDVSVSEGQFPVEPIAEFTVRLLGGGVGEDIAVSYRTVALPSLLPGAATPDVDFRPVDDVVIIPAGQTSAPIRVSVIGDSAIETDERFVVMLFDVDGGPLENIRLGMRTSGEGIIVNDDVARPTASIGDATVRERNAPGNSILNFPVTLDGPAATNVGIEYQILQLPGDGSATADVDFVSLVPGPLVIPRGQTSGTIAVVVHGDQIDELDEVLAVELVSVLDDSVTLGETLGVGTIVNDDDARLLASINQESQVNEGRGGRVTSFTMTISLSGDALVPSTVFVSTLDPAPGDFNAATPGIDFLPFENRAVQIPAGQRTGTFQVDVLGDEMPEADEFVLLSIVGATAGIDVDPALGTTAAAINDDDEDRPVVSIDTAVSTIENRPGLTSVARIPVRLSSVSDEVVTATFRTVASIPGIGLATDVDDPSTPQREDDFRATTGEVTFAPGQQVAFIQILVNGDDEMEPPETFAVDLTAVSPNVDLAPFATRSVATILDDNAAQPFVSLQAAANVGEPDFDGVTPVDLTVTLSGRLNSDVVVGYTIPDATAPGYATAVQDYVPVGRQELLIEAGQTTATLTVLVTGDDIPESPEQFFVQFLDVSPAALIDQDRQEAIVTINDNDAILPMFSIENASVQEGDPVGPDGVAPAQDPRLNFVISLSSVPDGPVSVEVETVRTDSAAPGIANTDGSERDVYATRRILFFDPQITSQVFSVRVDPDDRFEADEQVFIRLFNPVGAVFPEETLQGVGTVINDDFERPTVSISSTRLLEGDTPGERVAELTVTLDADPESGLTPDVTVGFRTTGLSATEGVDFESLSGQLEFSDGVRSQTIEIPILGDLDDERAEEFVVELFELDGTPLNADLNPAAFQGLVRIDNDDDPDVRFEIDDVRMREGTGGTTDFEFTVRRIGNSPSGSTVSFETSAGTAEAGDDFLAQSGMLTFTSDGPDTQIISVDVVADADLEEEFETFFVTLSDPQNASIPAGVGQAVGTILDDDQRVFAEDAIEELLEIAREIQEAIERVGNEPDNPELLALLDRLNRELIERVGPAMAIIIDPVDFLLTDLESRTVGYTESAGEVTEVPRAFYSGDGNVELVIIPAAAQGVYGLQLSGVGSGEFRAVATLVTADGFSKTILNADTLSGDAELALDFTDDTALPIQGQVIEDLAASNRASTPVGTIDEGTLAIADEVAVALGNVVSPDATITEQSEYDPFDPNYISEITAILRNLASELSGQIDSLPDMGSLLDPEVEGMLDAVFSAVGRQALGAPASLMLDLIDLLGVFEEEDGKSGSDDKANEDNADENGKAKDDDGAKNADQGNAEIERFLKAHRVAGAEKAQREALLWLEKRRRGELEKTSTDDVDSVFSGSDDIPVPDYDRGVPSRGTANTGRSIKDEPRADSSEEDAPEEAA